jgi:hypothetical protein
MRGYLTRKQLGTVVEKAVAMRRILDTEDYFF